MSQLNSDECPHRPVTLPIILAPNFRRTSGNDKLLQVLIHSVTCFSILELTAEYHAFIGRFARRSHFLWNAELQQCHSSSSLTVIGRFRVNIMALSDLREGNIKPGIYYLQPDAVLQQTNQACRAPAHLVLFLPASMINKGSSAVRL